MKIAKRVCLGLLAVLVAGLLLPERIQIPVAGATARDWNPKSFWFEPWGSSGVHKGIDIFGKTGTPVLSTTDGFVLFTGEIAKGGKVVLVLGPRWRLHYFAHLDSIRTGALSWVASGEPVGTLGASGNAQGKPPHLHYSIVRMLPAPWKMDGSTQGYKKALFIDPGAYLQD
ncbi:M23 family metallopeptidase [Acidovorax sp. LjRoot129]|uniref:M23 family metallopeptidase n=1 Tax=Acidovorax sp. LjRoot129 TaxID=3342260 RepID=UPI003ECD752A